MAAKPRREMSPRRTAKSVRSHEETMEAYGKAAGWHKQDDVFGKYQQQIKPYGPDNTPHVTGILHDKTNYLYMDLSKRNSNKGNN
jgi:hypothetical protein